MIHPEVQKHIPAIQALCREFGVSRLEIFGSAVTGEFDPQRSDVDFLATYPEGYDFGPWGERYVRFADKLESILGRRVDIVMDRAFRRKKNPYFQDSVNASRKAIFDASTFRSAA